MIIGRKYVLISAMRLREMLTPIAVAAALAGCSKGKPQESAIPTPVDPARTLTAEGLSDAARDLKSGRAHVVNGLCVIVPLERGFEVTVNPGYFERRAERTMVTSFVFADPITTTNLKDVRLTAKHVLVYRADANGALVPEHPISPPILYPFDESGPTEETIRVEVQTGVVGGYSLANSSTGEPVMATRFIKYPKGGITLGSACAVTRGLASPTELAS